MEAKKLQYTGTAGILCLLTGTWYKAQDNRAWFPVHEVDIKIMLPMLLSRIVEERRKKEKPIWCIEERGIEPRTVEKKLRTICHDKV